MGSLYFDTLSTGSPKNGTQIGAIEQMKTDLLAMPTGFYDETQVVKGLGIEEKRFLLLTHAID